MVTSAKVELLRQSREVWGYSRSSYHTRISKRCHSHSFHSLGPLSMTVICQCSGLWWKGTIVTRTCSVGISRMFLHFWWKLKRHAEEAVNGFCRHSSNQREEGSRANTVFSRHIGPFPQVKRLCGMYSPKPCWDGLHKVPRLLTDAWKKLVSKVGQRNNLV